MIGCFEVGDCFPDHVQILALLRAGDDGGFLGDNGRVGAITDKSLLALLDEVRLPGGLR